MKTLADYYPLCQFMYEDSTSYEKDLREDKELLIAIVDRLSSIEDWKSEVIGDAMLNLAQEKDISNSKFFMILRVAVSGKKITPPLNESMELLGKERTIQLVRQAARQG